MKFRCERDSLVEVLATAGRAVGTRSSAQMVLSGVRIESVGNHLSVIGTDLDLTVHVSTEAIGITDGVCVAPAKLLADIVRSLEPGAVTIESEGEKIEIGAARSRFSLRTFPVADFPSLPEPPEPATFLPGRRTGQCATPGRPGRVRRRRPPAADRCAHRARRHRGPTGGHRLLPTRPARHRGERRLRRDLADPGAGPCPGRIAATLGPRLRQGSRRRRRTRPAPRSACRSATTT